MSQAFAENVAKKVLKGKAEQYKPEDPLYEYVTDARGKRKRVKRSVPAGLSKKEEKVLRKIRRRAHYLDKGMNLCGFRVGWTFWIGIVPGLGDVVDATLNYTLVVAPAKQLDIPQSLLSQMLINNAISAGLGFVPLLGDVALAAWKANSRNAHLLEEYLVKRSQENARSGTVPMDQTTASTAGAGPSSNTTAMEQSALASGTKTRTGRTPGPGEGGKVPPSLPPRHYGATEVARR